MGAGRRLQEAAPLPLAGGCLPRGAGCTSGQPSNTPGSCTGPQCQRGPLPSRQWGQWVEKLSITSQHGLPPSRGSIRVSVSPPGTGQGLQEVENLPHQPPHQLLTPPQSAAPTSGWWHRLYQQSPAPSPVDPLGPHTKLAFFLVLEESEPDGMPDQCPHTSAKID